MSDNKPITDDLRSYLEGAMYDSPHCFRRASEHCDNIDAIHKSLEDVNEQLRKELKERPVAGDADVMAFVERLRDAAEKREDVTLFGIDYTALPLDADGVPIHVGDMMHGTCPSGKYVCGEVSAIGNNKFWLCNVQFSLCPDNMHHYHKPTAADVLREFADGIKNQNADFTELAIAEYAKRLQLAEGDDDE